MLVVRRVAFAFLGTRIACRPAGAEQALERLRVSRPDREGSRERLAGAGADPVEADAACESARIVLAQARVGAGGAGLGAVETRVDAARDRLRIETGSFPARREQLAGVAH